jgi:hypothetical protein
LSKGLSLYFETREVNSNHKIVVSQRNFTGTGLYALDSFVRIGDDLFIQRGDAIGETGDLGIPAAISKLNDSAQRLRTRAENEIPSEPGNCIEHAFLADKPDTGKEQPIEHIRIGFRLKEFPDTHLSIYVAPSNPHYSESNSLEWQLDQLEKNLAAQDPNHPQLKTKYLRRGARQIHDWLNGYEALSHTPEQPEAHSIHDFAMDFKGVPSDLLKPYADIRMQTGVADNAAGATTAILNCSVY